MNAGTVSIIVPVFNAARYLERCLQSILQQTYTDIEIILIDDGSSDGSTELCKRFAKEAPAVNAFFQSNHGISYTRNRGLREATGDYICFVDADDWIEPDYTDKMVEAITANGADMAMCAYYQNDELHEGKHITGRVAAMDALYMLLSEYVGHDLALWNKIFKSSLAKKCRFDESISYLEDGLFNCEYLQKAKWACFVSEPLYHYEINPSSLTHDTRPSEQRFSALRGQKLIIERTTSCPLRIQNLAKAKYQHQLRYVLFGSYMNGYLAETKPYLGQLKLYRKEFYLYHTMPLKSKIKYMGYAIIMKLDLGAKVAQYWYNLKRRSK